MSALKHPKGPITGIRFKKNGIIKCDNALYSMRFVKESRDALCRTGSQMIKCVMAFSDNQTLKKFFDAVIENRSRSTHPVVSGVCSYVPFKS